MGDEKAPPQTELEGFDDLDFEQEGNPIPPAPRMLDKPVGWKPRFHRDVSSQEQRVLRNIRHQVELAATNVVRVAQGKIRSFAWSGPPGVGKSHTTIQILEDLSVRYAYLRGRASPLALYRALFESRDKVVVLDDIDDVWRNHHSIELLKSGTERTGPRMLQWNTMKAPRVNPEQFNMTSKEVRTAGGKDSKGMVFLQKFQFSGAMVILTNASLRQLAQERKVLGLDPLLDRMHYQDMKHRDRRSVYLWCEHLVAHEALLHRMGLSLEEEALVMGFIRQRLEDWRIVSIRLVQKAGENLRDRPSQWMDLTKEEFK